MNPVVVSDRVYWSDVDKMDVVYYGKFVRFVERAEAAFFRAHGLAYDAIADRFGVWLMRVHFAMDFRQPARLDDTLSAWAEITRIGGSSLHFAIPIECDGRRVVDTTLILASVDRATMRAVRLPPDLLTALA